MIKAQIIIEVREDGKVYATGPLHDKGLCFAMLEEAKSIITNWKKTTIILPSTDDLKAVKK
jgi:acetylornithine deacetylase/succinyl-diaminopimelate desuccinylase-like protein